jgi:DNA-binding NarL/FixJ family response regulator
MIEGTPLRIATVLRPRARKALPRWFAAMAPGCVIRSFSDVADLVAKPGVVDDLDLIAVYISSATKPSRKGLEAIRALHTGLPSKPTVIVSARELASAFVAEAIRYGARGYLPMTLAPDAAAAGLRMILAGGTYVPATMLLSGSSSGESES